MAPDVSNAISVRAGPAALQRIREHGFAPHLFSSILGASGGPKWLALYGIDCVLAQRWFAPQASPTALVGSSIGSWRHACLAQREPGAALHRFLEAYLDQRYGRSPSPAEVSRQAAIILDHVLGSDTDTFITDRSDITTQVITVRCRSLTASEHPAIQALGLGLAAASNFITRRSLGLHFERVVFHTGANAAVALHGAPTRYVPCTPGNLRPALMASGAIPLVLAGVSDIPDAPPGRYRDGGMIDYHFDFNMTWPDGLCLFPHFSPSIVPGWFDKNIPWRRLSGSLLDRVVLLGPSEQLVRNLPYGKIPSREDFRTLGTQERIAYWKRAVAETERAGDALRELLDHPDPARFIAAL
jgi:hypothetical protein